MEKIKVFMKYPWRNSDSSYHKNIIKCSPKDVEYLNNTNKIKVIGSTNKFEKTRKLKNVLRKILTIMKIPNIVLMNRTSADLIHCAHCLPLTKKPWIVDTEIWSHLSSSEKISNSFIGKKIIKIFLERENCKKIICWSEDCKNSFINAFPKNKKIQEKLEVLHYAFTPKKISRKNHKKIKILFIARRLEEKGGRQVLEVFDQISKSNKNLELIFICPTQKEYLKKYSQNKQIKFFDLVPQEKLFHEIYPTSDIFFYPGIGDTYGFALPEAMSYELPIITANTMAKEEFVENGKEGFVIHMPDNWKKYPNYTCMDEKMLNEFIEKLSILIQNKKLRLKMGTNAKKKAKKLFSTELRNKKLMKMYKYASY